MPARRRGRGDCIDTARTGRDNTRLFRCRHGRQARRLITEFPVANIKSARKRARQADKHRLHNMGLRSRMRTQIKAVIKAIEKGDKAAATAAYQAAVPVIDSMINKRIISANKAARHKSRVNRRIQALSA